MGWQFRAANFAERFGPIRFACVPPWRSQQFFSSSSPVTACQVHESFPGEKHMGDVTHQFLGRSICREVPFDQVGATCQVGGRHGSCGPWGGADTPSRPSRLHEPAHRLWTGCNTTHVPRLCGPVYNRWVCLESLKKYVTKMASSSRCFWVSDMPLLRQA